MVQRQAAVDGQIGSVAPTVRAIGTADLFDALAKGVADFREKPSHLMILAVVYPLAAFVLARVSFGYDVLPLLFPLAAGFALLGPVAAIGLYELSRRRELGQPIGWSHAFGVVRSPSIGAIIRLGLILAAIFILWLLVAYGIYRALFGDLVPASIGAFADQIFYTWNGWAMIIVGNAVGFLFALVVLTISVVSFPLLIDRNIGAAAAMWTSIRAVFTNPRPMLLWGLIVAIALLVGSIPFFIGLCIVMPVLGHATWHLYRRVVAW